MILGFTDRPRQRKSLGQVFLKVDWPAKKIIEKLKEWQVTTVIEIGPGGGALTKHLLQDGLKVIAIEKDERFSALLQETLGQAYPDQLRIVNQDILKQSYAEFRDEVTLPNETIAIIGNIPYYISTPILEWALDSFPQTCGAIFLVQLEFAQRVASKPGNKIYGSLSVFAQLRCEVALIARVGRKLFKPIPKVDSAIIALTPTKTSYDSGLLKYIESLSKALFSQRRKQLRNSVRAFAGEDLNLETFPFDLTLRPEQLKPEDFVVIAKYIRGHVT